MSSSKGPITMAAGNDEYPLEEDNNNNQLAHNQLHVAVVESSNTCTACGHPNHTEANCLKALREKKAASQDPLKREGHRQQRMLRARFVARAMDMDVEAMAGGEKTCMWCWAIRPLSYHFCRSKPTAPFTSTRFERRKEKEKHKWKVITDDHWWLREAASIKHVMFVGGR